MVFQTEGREFESRSTLYFMNLDHLQFLISKQKRALRAERNIRVRGIDIPCPMLYDSATRDCKENERPLRVWKRWFKNHTKIQEIVKRLTRQISSAKSELKIA